MPTSVLNYKKSLAESANKKLKRRLFSLLSDGQPKCQCCGETCLEFLTLDHINNDGKYDKNGKGSNPYYKIIKKPIETLLLNYRVLCFNCNCGRSVNGGECPHIFLNKIKNLINNT